MSGEISERYGKAKTLIALDPPSEINGRYKVKLNPEQERKNFIEYAQFSRSFVGHNSFAGNHDFAKSANESFVLDFGNIADVGAEHANVVTTFAALTAQDGDPGTNIGKLYNNMLDIGDIPNESSQEYTSRYMIDPSFINNFKGKIAVDDKNGAFTYTQQLIGIKNGRNQIFGSSNTNRLNQKDRVSNPNEKRDIPDNDADIWGGDGNDIFFANDETSTKETFIKDFKDSGDRINLFNEEKTSGGFLSVKAKYAISPNSTNQTKFITRTLCVNNYDCLTNRYGNDHSNVVVEGSRVNDTQNPIDWSDELNKAKTNQSNVFIFR